MNADERELDRAQRLAQHRRSNLPAVVDPQSVGGLGALLMRVPERVRHTCTPLQIMLRVFGVEPGWRCTGCGRPYELEDFTRRTDVHGKHCGAACPACLKPLPRRCANPGCGNNVPPLPQFSRKTDSRKPVGWYDGPPECEECTTNLTARARTKKLSEGMPKMALEGAIAWQPDTAWRRSISMIASDWSKGNRQVPMLYIHGPVGTGKTVAAAYIVRRVVLATGCEYLAITERQLLDAHRDRFSDGDEPWRRRKANEAVELIMRAKSCPVLVIDELWAGGAGHYTDRQVDLVWEILSARCEARSLTVFVSNTPYTPDDGNPAATIWHYGLSHGADGQRGEAMASRFALLGEEIECQGRDRRRINFRGDQEQHQ